MLLSRQTLSTTLVFCACILGISWIQLPQLQALISTQQTPSLATLERDVQVENLRLRILKQMPSFSYDNFIGDWVYIDFLQYFGDDEARVQTGYSLSPEYFDVILNRDPRFLDAYLGLSVSTSLYAGMPERSVKLTNQGLKYLTPWVPAKSYYVWRYKGTDELLFLGNAQAAKASFANAANWASNFSDPESQNVAFISGKTAEFLEHNPDSKYARIATWGLVLQRNVDEKTQKRAIKEIEALGGKVVKTAQGHQIVYPPKD